VIQRRCPGDGWKASFQNIVDYEFSRLLRFLDFHEPMETKVAIEAGLSLDKEYAIGHGA